MGSAAVDFQVGTGRMPAQQPGAQVPKKKVIYTQAEIDQLAAYVASLGAGPVVPTEAQVNPEAPTSPGVATCSVPTARSATTSPVRAVP